MTETTEKPVVIAQPMRVNIQCSVVVESEEEGRGLYEEIGIFVKSMKPAAMISANLLKMLSPCCGDKKNNAIPNRQA